MICQQKIATPLVEIGLMKRLTLALLAVSAVLVLAGCAINDDLQLADNCSHTPGCVSSSPGSGYGPSHQRASDPVGPAGVPPRR